MTCATYLAKSGLKVVVLEKNATVGGAAITEEFHPGFRNSVASYTVSLLNPKVIDDLELRRHGLRIVERPVANFWPMLDGPGLVMPNGLEKRKNAIAEFSSADANMLPQYFEDLDRAADLLRDLVLETPPNAGGGILELIKGAKLGRRLVREDLEAQRILIDLFTKSAADFLNRYFECDIVKSFFAFDGVIGAFAAPSTPGTAYVLLHHCFGEVNGKPGAWGHAIGGMGAITQAMARSAVEAGVDIQTDAKVARIEMEDDRAAAVMLTSGAKISAQAIAANVPPKLLFRDLVPQTAVAPEIHRRFTSLKSGSATFRMNVALSELPNFSSRPGTNNQDHHGSGIVIGPSMTYLEKAYLDAKRDGWSVEPIVEMLIPSTLDDTLAPPGQHVASLFVQHVSPRLPGDRSWSEHSEKDAFADLVIETVNRYAPNFSASVIARQVLSPLDLETRFGLIDGDIFHGQLGLDQLFATRPVMGHANYRMPVPGLYLCGSGAHPGGGVTGAPGHNAAREILRDMRRKLF
ncbi:MAG: NAD(P)/FAD-dependent oxidoreductase [Pseudomonadota bacterium]